MTQDRVTASAAGHEANRRCLVVMYCTRLLIACEC